MECPEADKEQPREEYVPAPAQRARRDAVTHHAADVDAVRGGDEAVRLMQGLTDRLVPERFVEVRRCGQESGDIGRGFAAGGVGYVPPGVLTLDGVSDVQRGFSCELRLLR
jgi:hypothetical protein